MTPALQGTILPGVTRDSVISLHRLAGVSVAERRISIEEVLEAHETGTLTEAFGTGTAAVLSSIRRIGFRERTIKLPPVEGWRIAPEVKSPLVAIATGREPGPEGWVVTVD